mmetsp:Transcript_22072/g.19642  ORF Transcript_22072/g.19642 Transcript_22072/m.19642 type:complete len:82 (-) Transcript_22072:323-568(-)
MLKEIINESSPNKIPPSLLIFLKDSYTKGALILPEHIDQFECNRVDLDMNNTLYNCTSRSRTFLRLYFLFGKILPQIYIDK